MGKARWPRVAVTMRRTERKNRFIDYVGESHLRLLMTLRLLPVIIPVTEGTKISLGQFEERLDGLLIPEGEDIEPRHYRATAANRKYLEKTHPLKDDIEVALIRHAYQRKIPILGICRGSQLMNVVAGGTLYGDVQKEKKSARKHIHPTHYDSYRHPINLVPGTPMEQWYARRSLKVNSYHHQGVRDLAPRFRAMAYADDGLIEAFYDPSDAFTVGLQFHPERMLPEYKGNLHVWQAFAKAVQSRRL